MRPPQPPNRPTAQPPLRPHPVNSLAQPVGGVDFRIVPRGEIERCIDAPGELPRPPRLHLVAPAHRVRPERTAQARHRRVGGKRVAEIQGDSQGVLVTLGFTGIEVEPRQHHVVALDNSRIDLQTHQRVARIRPDDDPAMLLPPSSQLHALRVARTRQDVTSPKPQSQGPNQYTLKYLSSSHSLTFPMYSCHSPRLASTKRS